MPLFSRNTRRVTVEEARRRTQGTNAPSVLLDVREKSEWNAGRAPATVHAPLSGLVAGAALPQAAQGRPLVVICRSGNRSQKAAALLSGRGLNAVDVKGGMRAWAAAGHPVVDARGNNGSVA
ncbi:rhodanese-like domain-containing protein [Streptomyces sp. SCSIO 75703]|uniref:rhodanese-like domain-containing protein n=1 Tax=unclassified Streptomyces TaxID=2593676 RepID=UPI0004BFDB59|nr:MULTISPECIES: rhodanese-like domain-containing protein [unclassified Streptomyces]